MYVFWILPHTYYHNNLKIQNRTITHKKQDKNPTRNFTKKRKTINTQPKKLKIKLKINRKYALKKNYKSFTVSNSFYN